MMSEDTNATDEFDDDLLGEAEEEVPTPAGFESLDADASDEVIEDALPDVTSEPEVKEAEPQRALDAMKADAGPDDPSLTRDEDKRDPVLRATEIHHACLKEVKEIEAVLVEAKDRLNQAVALMGEVRQQVPLHVANKNAQRTTRVEIGRRTRAMESIRKMELHFRPRAQDQRKVRQLIHPGQ